MDCIVLAGGTIGPDDPLSVHGVGQPKALIRIGTLTMLEWVVRALQQAQAVERIAVVGLERPQGWTLGDRVDFIPDQGGMIDNALKGVAWYRARHSDDGPLLFCSADIPAITGQIVDAHLEMCRPFNRYAYYSFVSKQNIERVFPNARRTYSTLRDGPVAGGDMVLIRTELAELNRDLWDTLANSRKHPWKIARIVGLGTILGLLLGRLTVAGIERRAERIVGRPVRVLISPYAELAMDGDKPHQVNMLQDYLLRDGKRT